VTHPQENPAFFIKNLPVMGRFILAPMDGYTDSAMRRISRSFGSAISYSEFLNAIDVTYGHPHLSTQSYFHESERPFIYQIYDDQPERFLKAALRLAENHPDAVDINLGCSAKNVSNRGAGAGLLRSPDKIARIASSLVKNLSIPITAKIRLGWDEQNLNYHQVAHILEDCGISLITVHARTRRQEFTGTARWQAIAEVKNEVKIPVIGNGDVKSYEGGSKMLSETGCDAVMIGRAAIGNPWIFAGSDRQRISREELYSTITRHLDLMVDLYGGNIAVPMFRKHLIRYLHEFLTTSDIRRKIFTIDNPSTLLEEIKELIFEEASL
jgi:nifR3 family TIM-barrel protein